MMVRRVNETRTIPGRHFPTLGFPDGGCSAGLGYLCLSVNWELGAEA